MNKRIISISILLSPIFIAALALFWGAYDISPSQVIRAIWNSVALSQKETEVDIVMNIRLPRILLSGLVGIALSGSGVTLQGIFKNPLVDPFILAFQQGSLWLCHCHRFYGVVACALVILCLWPPFGFSGLQSG